MMRVRFTHPPAAAQQRHAAGTLTEYGKRPSGTAGLGSYPIDARAAPGLPFVYQPLCWRPNVCDSNHCGTLSRWSHVNLRSGLVSSIFGCTGRLSRPSSSRRTIWVPRTSPQAPREPSSTRVDAALAPLPLSVVGSQQNRFRPFKSERPCCLGKPCRS
jgi:hypothetical protein